MIAFDYLTGALTGGAQPSSIGKKFAPDGAVLRDPGCTTICHVDKTSPAFAAITRAQEALKAGPFAGDFAYLPPASFHMTIFDAFIESGRSRERVPAHLPENATVEEITDDISKNLDGIEIAKAFQARPVGVFGGFSVSMIGKDDAAERLLRQTRDTLSAASHIRRSDHNAYRFHITLAYNLRWFQPEEALQIIALSEDVGRRLVEEVPEVMLGPVEFCSFENMHHFEPLKLL
ncbi:MAG: DUF1868 domain-containing protein [Pseudomonadota bacterium]